MSALLEGESLDNLRLAAEEIAFLTGRGYDAAVVQALVGERRKLTAEGRAVLDDAVCSETTYKARALKEMLPEDIARRPLVVDGHGVLEAVAIALDGGLLLERIDQTLLPVGDSTHALTARLDEALAKIGPILREMRPSKTKWILDGTREGVHALEAKLVASAKGWKVPVEVVVASDREAALRASSRVATSDARVIDACRSWCNLAGPVVDTIAGARRVKVQ